MLKGAGNLVSSGAISRDLSKVRPELRDFEPWLVSTYYVPGPSKHADRERPDKRCDMLALTRHRRMATTGFTTRAPHELFTWLLHAVRSEGRRHEARFE